MFVKKSIIPILFLFTSLPVSAHSIFLDCFQNEDTIKCKASFSDGSSAEGFTIEVISYEDELLTKGKTDQHSSFSFNIPNQDYYILMDAGPGHVTELDMLDVQ